jgi:hypothetical protein
MVLRCTDSTDSSGLGEGIEDGEREISVMGFDRLIQPIALPRRTNCPRLPDRWLAAIL